MKTSLLLCLLLLVRSAYAESWARYGQTDDANLYYDKHRIIKMGSTAMIWDLHDFKTAALDPKGKPYRSALYATEYNCRLAQYRLLSVQRLADAMGKGALISEDVEAGTWKDVAASALAEKLLTEACDLK